MLTLAAPALAVAAGLPVACTSLHEIDQRINRLVATRAEAVNAEQPPTVDHIPREVQVSEDQYETDLETLNPPAAALEYEAAPTEPGPVLRQLTGYYLPPESPLELDLSTALHQAQRTAREFLRAEEDFILAAIALLIERHQYSPRFFNSIATAIDAADDDFEDAEDFDAALSVINDLRVTQRLPYGGQVEAQLITAATRDLIDAVDDGWRTTNELILSADIPLLRDAGQIARESLIQAERNLIYAARFFERFRRELLFSIATDYFQLVNQLQVVYNQRAQLENLNQLFIQQRALVNAGRVPPFELKNVQQRLLGARVALLNAQERYFLALDRFKIRLGLDVTDEVMLIPIILELDDPEATVEAAARQALALRLDFQNEVDQVDDARRSIAIARNQTLPELDFGLSASVGTNPNEGIDRFSLAFEDAGYDASLTFGLPLDRVVEKANVRRAIIDLQQAIRELTLFRDNIILESRAALRAVKQARYAYQLQVQAVEINELRQEELELRRAEVNIQFQIDAADDLLRSRNQLIQALTDLQIAILGYLLATGQLRVEHDGGLQPLPGMEIEVRPLTSLLEGLENPAALINAPYTRPEDLIDPTALEIEPATPPATPLAPPPVPPPPLPEPDEEP